MKKKEKIEKLKKKVILKKRKKNENKKKKREKLEGKKKKNTINFYCNLPCFVWENSDSQPYLEYVVM